ncbi:MAG: transporter substrate-binding domain-containing protein [Chloroflexota bacterium]|nr:transporter substrate-binding domain-containing protein [Anaerolineae bacterium]
MKRFTIVFALLVTLLLLMIGFSPSFSAELVLQPAPTLVPPTLVPEQDAAAGDVLLAASSLVQVQKDGAVRVGLLYNAPPFGTLNVRGEVSGYDADLAKKMAEAWGVKFIPVQVTRQTGVDMLTSGKIDMLLGLQTHRRDMDAKVEFSLTYFAGTESMLVRQDDGAAKLADMSGRKVGYVLGTPAAEAIGLWQQRSGISITMQSFLTIDQAYSALVNNEIDGVVDSRVTLTKVIPQAGMGKVLDEAVGPEPYAIAVRRQDINWRNLINKTLQYLSQKGTLQELQKTYLGGLSYSPNLIPIWAGIGTDAPKPGQLPQDVPYPKQYEVPLLEQAKAIKVAGVSDLPADAPESQKRLEATNRAVIEAMAAKWGFRVDYIPNSAANAVDLVANGQADIAIGVPLDWASADKVDFTAAYLLHGERVMVKKSDDYETFLDLRARIVGIFNNEDGVEDRVKALATSAQSSVRVFVINNEQDAASVILSQNNANAVFGDSLKLIAHVQANPNDLRLTHRGTNPDAWYSRVYIGMAVPRNDIDFRLLVEYTLQELARSGQLQTLLGQVLLPEDVPSTDIWPGVSDYLGFKLG